MASLMQRATKAAAARAEACTDETATLMFVGFDVDTSEMREEAYAYAATAIPYVRLVGAPTAFAGTWMAGFTTGLHYARLRDEDARSPKCSVCGSPASRLSGRVVHPDGSETFACSAQCAQRGLEAA